MLDWQNIHVCIVTGHYGTGKSNLAVNLALWAKKEGRDVVLADLDIVNPFFRSTDCEKMLRNAGIELVRPLFANTAVDLPALSARIDALLRDKSKFMILDIGGDDAGAAALGRYAGLIAQTDYTMLYVVSQKRFLTTSAVEMAQMLAEIENASHLKATGIVNNTNLSHQTGKEDIVGSFSCVRQLCAMTGLPLIATTVKGLLADNLAEEYPEQRITPISIYVTHPLGQQEEHDELY